MKTHAASGLLVVLFSTALASPLHAAVVYSQPHNGSGALYQSAVNGTDYDQLTWDMFHVTNPTAITQVRWRGGYLYGGTYSGPATNWTLAIYRDIANGYQPDVIHPPFASYTISGSANETPAGVFGNTALYDYSVTLPSAFQAVAGSNYWLLVRANQVGIPEWGLAQGAGGDGGCFRRVAGAADWWFYRASGDTAFTLGVADGPTVAIAASASPAEAGEILGAGNYPVGSTAAVIANPATGYGFVNWTQNGQQVSASPNYLFTATSNRTLVAHFVPAYTIAVSASPSYGGTVSGGGTFNSNAPVTVTATPNGSFAFVNWTEFGTPVSTSASYSFNPQASRTLVANFAPSSASATFDFDTGSPPVGPGAGMPGSQTAGGVTAYFTASGNTWSVQNIFASWVPGVFSGNFLYPNSMSRGSIAVEFSRPATNFSMAFFTGEVSSEYDVAGLVQVTAYTDSAMASPVATNSARGDWLTGAYPEGTLSLGSATPFVKVKIEMPTQSPAPSYLFWVDNLVVQLAAPTFVTITASASPTNAGILSGDGAFLAGESVTLVATPNAGYDFVNWTESGVPVSASASYTFAATTNRVLTANFVQLPPSWSIGTTALPSNGGTTLGDGIYTNGQPVVVSALASSGYDFVDWTEDGVAVSRSADFSFNATTNRLLVANFAPAIIPRLAIQLVTNAVVLAWPTNSMGFTPERTVDFNPTNWFPVAEPISVVGTNHQVIVSTGAGKGFLRLVHP